MLPAHHYAYENRLRAQNHAHHPRHGNNHFRSCRLGLFYALILLVIVRVWIVVVEEGNNTVIAIFTLINAMVLMTWWKWRLRRLQMDEEEQRQMNDSMHFDIFALVNMQLQRNGNATQSQGLSAACLSKLKTMTYSSLKETARAIGEEEGDVELHQATSSEVSQHDLASGTGIVSSGTREASRRMTDNELIKRAFINSADACSVCLSDYENQETIMILPCAHIYHKQCVEEWFANNKTCPLCKAEVTSQLPDDVSEERPNPTTDTYGLIANEPTDEESKV
jgi:hypothetical protein